MVRVRFAPSPTGDLHVGGLRTALYNYLFARKMGGKFILRIEDTDRERHVPEAASSILNILRSCGLKPDEGPEIGGDFSPYIQSERLDHYRKAAERLIEKGFAYPCFCPQERLDEMRAKCTGKDGVFGYDRRCRDLDKSTAADRMANEPHVIRLKVPLAGEVSLRDIVWGDVVFPYSDVDDQVLIKSDGYPTYHLANVVDDIAMEITHVIRGEEWLPSIPKHLLLYQYLEAKPPQFAHLPLILNQDRHKLSKREGSGSVGSWLKQGIPPEALVNYTALLGWRTEDDREIYSLPELIAAFSLERVNRAGAVFDPVKLLWLSGEHIKKMDTAQLAQIARLFLRNTEFYELLDQSLQLLLSAVKDRIQKLDELVERLAPFGSATPQPDEEARFWLSSEIASRIFPLIIGKMKQEGYDTSESFMNAVKQIGKEANVKGKDLWMPVRAALTGRTAGPELRVIVDYIGVKRALERLDGIIN